MNNIRQIKIIDETACIMFLDSEENYIESFFINQYYFQLINKRQKNALKSALLKPTKEFQELWLKDDNELYLTYVSTKNEQLVDVIYNNGSREVKKAIDVLGYMDYHEFNILHDFVEAKNNVSIANNG